MKEGKTTFVQYVFLDVVKFTQNRTIEAQVDIIKSLNSIVQNTLVQMDIENERILLPTGDGICIAILKSDPFDLSLTISLDILKSLAEYNETVDDKKRKFDIRVGINQNVDNLVIDVNNNQNIAGRGINMAQRIMSLADGGQIIVGSSVYEILCERESYSNYFRRYKANDKHGNSFKAYQYINSGCKGLDTDIPFKFKEPEKTKSKLNQYQAYYLANAISQHDFFFEKKSEHLFDYVSSIITHLMSEESIDRVGKSEYANPTIRVKRDEKGSIAPMYESVKNSEFWIVANYSNLITSKLLDIRECFEDLSSYQKGWAFPSEVGKKRLKDECPNIWKEFNDNE